MIENGEEDDVSLLGEVRRLRVVERIDRHALVIRGLFDFAIDEGRDLDLARAQGGKNLAAKIARTVENQGRFRLQPIGSAKGGLLGTRFQFVEREGLRRHEVELKAVDRLVAINPRRLF